MINWPFTSKATIASLERVSASEVEVAHFHKLFFPKPGYIAEDVKFKRPTAPHDRPLATIAKITCLDNWLALLTFTHTIDRMNLEGVQVYIPSHVPPPIHKHPNETIKTTVTELIANGAVLDIAPRQTGGQTLRFEFPQLIVKNVQRNKALRFTSEVNIPTPPGRLNVSGAVGPFRAGQIGETNLSGDFHLHHADLGMYKVIAGIVSADGSFQGALAHVRLSGRAQIPNFEVTSSRHSLGISVEYRTLVNGTNGDVAIQSAQAHFMDTTLFAHGEIAGQHGKTVSLELNADRARVQDLLRLFVTADRPPFAGPINLSAKVVLPPEHRPFIRRVQLDGNFTVKDGEFTNPGTQDNVDKLSSKARGNASSGPPLQHITEDLGGKVDVRNGIANISAAQFTVPGASATGGGTYDLSAHVINLRGKLAMQASLSKAVKGIKSVFLIPLDPLFKKNGHGAVLPVKITGTYEHPRFGVSLVP
ncbi:MAG TPA: AsmA-like C-terminal region-containing protein [Bryobacteraceae bacterium]|nr:AsmA-like C-terminal region-containing protein [Bryobacteraceae bacterium]